MTSAEVRDRIASVCASQPFGFTLAQTPFSFDLQPSGAIDEVFRVEIEAGEVIGGFNYNEEYTDRVTIWLARKYNSQPEATYRQLRVDATSLRAAVIRDALVQSGQYCVPDGETTATIAREEGREFAVLQVTLPVNYEGTV